MHESLFSRCTKLSGGCNRARLPTRRDRQNARVFLANIKRYLKQNREKGHVKDKSISGRSPKSWLHCKQGSSTSYMPILMSAWSGTVNSTEVRRSIEPCDRSKPKKSGLIYFLVSSTFLHTAVGASTWSSGQSLDNERSDQMGTMDTKKSLWQPVNAARGNERISASR